MSDFLQQLFNFYFFRGGWLWLALVPLAVLIFMVIDNQRRQRQALTWILFLVACVCVFAPSLFYSLSDGKALTQSTREIFYGGILGVLGAVLGCIGYVVSFQWHVTTGSPHEGIAVRSHDRQSRVSGDDVPLHREGINSPAKQDMNVPIMPGQAVFSPAPMPPVRDGLPVASLPASFFDHETGTAGDEQGGKSKVLALGWLQDSLGRQYPVYEGITHIGREDDQDVRLSDITVSRRHAIIRHEVIGREAVFILQVIGQSETTLNRIMIGKDPKQLHDGDRIRFGTTDLIFLTQAPH